jgi:CheY-like chemotaxis protein
LLGGEIRVISVPSTGSTFTFYLARHYVAVPQITGAPRPVTRAPMPMPLPRPPVPVDPIELAPPASVPKPAHDDRESIEPGDQVLLIIEDDAHFARILLDAAHAQGLKGVIASEGGTDFNFAQKLKPSGIALDLRLPDLEGWAVLDRLKHHPTTRHVPVAIFSADDHRHRALRMGAVSFVLKPTTIEAVNGAIETMARFAEAEPRRLRVVEDDVRERESIVELVGGDGVVTKAVGTGHEALAALDVEDFHCMVLDLGLPDMRGIDLLTHIKQRGEPESLPIIVYTGRDLGSKEETELRKFVEAIIVKDVRSPERLLYETSLYLHRNDATLSEVQRRVLDELERTVPALASSKILVVDDDVRNIFAITSALERHGANVVFAENGRDGLELLEKTPNIRAVLMDIMMPEMDGYEVIRRIRAEPRYQGLPVIAVTAKAMQTDREKCIEAGATDYIAKPVDVEHLLSLLRVWMEN